MQEIRSFFRDAKRCFNASWGLKRLSGSGWEKLCSAMTAMLLFCATFFCSGLTVAYIYIHTYMKCNYLNALFAITGIATRSQGTKKSCSVHLHERWIHIFGILVWQKPRCNLLVRSPGTILQAIFTNQRVHPQRSMVWDQWRVHIEVEFKWHNLDLVNC